VLRDDPLVRSSTNGKSMLAARPANAAVQQRRADPCVGTVSMTVHCNRWVRPHDQCSNATRPKHSLSACDERCPQTRTDNNQKHDHATELDKPTVRVLVNKTLCYFWPMTRYEGSNELRPEQIEDTADQTNRCRRQKRRPSMRCADVHAEPPSTTGVCAVVGYRRSSAAARCRM